MVFGSLVLLSDEKGICRLLLNCLIRFSRSLSLKFSLCCGRLANVLAVLQALCDAMFPLVDVGNSGTETVSWRGFWQRIQRGSMKVGKGEG